MDSATRTKRQTIELITPVGEFFVNGDAGRIQQVFANLLSNASKVSAENSAIRVTIALECPDLRVDVQDHGRGIAAETMPHIFEMFRQSTDGEGDGLRIGLSVVRGLVELHGGTVDVHSAGLGFGTTFVVRSPKAD